MTELKADGATVHPTKEQFIRLIRTPLATRRERLGITFEQLAERTGLSNTAIMSMTGYGARSEVGVYISTIARVMDALDYAITVENFNKVVSIGGKDLAATLAKVKLNPWRAERPTNLPNLPVPPPSRVGVAGNELNRDAVTGVCITSEQAWKLFHAMLEKASSDMLWAELNRRGVPDRYVLEYVAENGWMVVR